MSDLETRLVAVQARIDVAVREAGRRPGSVLLVAVSKTKPEADLRALYAAGQRDFGENYVQELVGKAEALADLPDLRFHFIGHLQRNKAKQVARIATAVHTVDSVKLAHELGKRAAEAAPGSARLRALVEVNLGGEAQKSGCTPAELGAVLDAVDAEPALELSGLMTVPPFTEDPAGARPVFDALVVARDRYGGVTRLPELSMGMTRDLEQAIFAGATIVRVGTALFGER